MKRSALEKIKIIEDSNVKISGFIDKIAKMSKNPTIDANLGEVLDEFLKKLKECDKYLEHGIFNMNFAEAALLLQSSADLYSKKVDLLWDIIFDYQKRIVLSEKKNTDQGQELEKIEERQRKYKRKRKTNLDKTQTSQLVNKFSFGSVESVDYLEQTFEPNDLLTKWEKFSIEKTGNDIPDKQESIKNSLFLPDSPVHTEDNDYVGKYNQFHCASLVEEIFHLEENKLLQDSHGCVIKMRIDSYVIHDFLYEKSIPSNRPIKQYAEELKKYIANFVETQKQIKDGSSFNLSSDNYVSLEKFPSNTVIDKTRKMSTADSLFEDDHMDFTDYPSPGPADDDTHFNSLPSVEPSNEISDVNCDNEPREAEDAEVESHMSSDQVAGTLEKRNKSSSQDSAFYEFDEESVMSPGPTVAPPKSSITDSQLCLGSSVVIARPRLAKLKRIIQEIKEQDAYERKQKQKPPVKKRRIAGKKLMKLATGITASLDDFEKFHRQQYKPAENEGVVPQLSSASEESDDEVDSQDVREEINAVDSFPPSDPCEETEPLEETSVSQDLTPLTNFDLHDSSKNNSTIPGFVNLENVRDLPEMDIEHEEVSRRNVREWRSFILPKLKSMNNKSDFDIHEYGSKIIESSEIGEKQHFKKIVAGKSRAEIARFFIATLQLANTNNIKITGVVPGQLANETFNVTVVNKTRYHELLEDYQAPSEETFRERLEKAKALNPMIPLHSTPCGMSAKRLKLSDIPSSSSKTTKVSRKKLF